MLWGFLGLGGSLIGALQIVSAIYIGIEGRKLAWKYRRFESIQDVQEEALIAWLRRRYHAAMYNHHLREQRSSYPGARRSSGVWTWT
jgi:hypothetical protein